MINAVHTYRILFDLAASRLSGGLSFTRGVMVLLIGSACLGAAAEDLILTEDTTIHVESGTRTYGALVGTGFKLTKTGAGTLTFTHIENSSVKIDLREGTLGVVQAVVPEIVKDAFLHVDAAMGSTMELESTDDKTYVKKWNSANGNSRYATATTRELAWLVDPAERRPILRAKAQNGLDVVDFGMAQVAALLDGDQKPIGYGAAMDWGEASSELRDIFVIAGRHESARTLAIDYPQIGSNTMSPPFIGATGSSYDFLGGAFSTTAWPNLLYPNPNVRAHKGVVTIDGAAIPTNIYGYLIQEYPAGLHLVNFIPDDALTGGTFARDRDVSFGGVLLGEAIVFTGRLSDAQRAEVCHYLSAKWFPIAVDSLTMATGTVLELGAGVHLAVDAFEVRGEAELKGAGDLTVETVVGETLSRMSFPTGGRLSVAGDAYVQGLTWGETFIKSGDGTLTVAEAGTGGSVNVQSGTLRIDALANRGTWFHVDASDANHRTVVNDGGQHYVNKLSDVDGKSRSASATTTQLDWLPLAAERRPKLRVEAQNGLDIVDFGMQQVSSLKDDQSKPIGYGAAMDWSEGSTTMRDVFVVAGRHESTKTLAKTYTQIGSNTQASPFIGWKDSTYYHFLGGNIIADGLSNPNLLYVGNPNVWAHKGVVTIDGVAMPTNINGYLVQEYPEGLHVVNFASDVDLAGGTFARDRYVSFGGALLGEAMIFTNRVSEVVRSRVRKSLQVKWLAADDYPVYAYLDLLVAADAAFELPNAELSVSGTLVPDGEVRVGKLTLNDGANVRLDVADPLSLVGTEFRIVKCDAVSLDPKNVSVTGNLAEVTRVRLVSHADGLYASVKDKNMGLMIIFR